MKNNLILLFCCCITHLANCQTSIPGGYVSGTWTLAGSPYLIQGSIMIPNDSTLTIQPGVEVNFQGHYKLLVKGRLLAIGTVTDSILFTTSDTITKWYGIRFDSTYTTNDTSKFFYCIIQWGLANGSGHDQQGGGFYFYNYSKAIISNCTIQHNSTGFYRGGGIACMYFSDPIITDNNISFNSDIAIYCEYASPLISNNTISYNIAPDGGGIFCYHGCNSLIINNVIFQNTATSDGGGIYLDGGSGAAVLNNTITNNHATVRGGGILRWPSSVGSNISYNTISNNSASAGGAIHFRDNGVWLVYNDTLLNNTITNNSASHGGGIECEGSAPILINNTITNNSATGNGGALYCLNSAGPLFRNNIMYGNTATNGAQVFLEDELSDPDFYYCDIEGGLADFELNGNFYTGFYQNNIDSLPSFISPSAGSGTGFNGVTADWSLQSISPCINAGDPVGNYPATDKAGNPRVFNGIIDIGAYEFQGNIGIADFDLQNQIMIYPNPLGDELNVSVNENINFEIILYDFTSRKLLQKKFINSITLNTEQLSKGLYLYEVRSKDGSYKKGKVVKD
jgi:parallel beta-helix repeat protein